MFPQKRNDQMRILILTNHQSGLFRFRKELLERFVSDGNEVYVSVPDGEFTNELQAIGLTVVPNECLDRRGTNPVKDLRLISYYKNVIEDFNPDVVLTYTIKPNVYGGYICGKMHVPYIANVTGLGTSIENKGIMQSVILWLYRIGLRKAQKVFFQNSDNLRFMLGKRIVREEATGLLPGSGVNTEEHGYETYPSSDEKIVFTTIGRIMKDKGIFEILDAAHVVKKDHPNVIFRLIGDFDEADLRKSVEEAVEDGTIEYYPFQKNIKPFIAESHAIIHASYHEGMSNVLLEAASSGRPVLATNVPGCIETFDSGISGIAFEPRNTSSLVNAIKKFMDMEHYAKEQMGKAGHEKVLKEFDREIVIDKYVNEIRKIGKNG